MGPLPHVPALLCSTAALAAWDRQQDTGRRCPEPPATLQSSPTAWVTFSLSPHVLQPLTAGAAGPARAVSHDAAPYLMVLSPPHQPIPALCWQHWESPACAAGGITKNLTQTNKAAWTTHISLQLPRRALLGPSEGTLQAHGPEMHQELLDFLLSPNPRIALLEQALSFLLPHQLQTAQHPTA